MDLLSQLDQKFFFAVHHLQDFQLNLLLAWPTYLGGLAFAAPFVFILGLLFYREARFKNALLCLTPLLLSQGITDLLKKYFQRPRPFNFFTDPADAVNVLFEPPQNYSFPSGHATTAFSLAVILNRCFKVPAAAAYGLAVWICLTRLYVGVHFPSDLLAGALVGFLMTQAWIKIFKLRNFAGVTQKALLLILAGLSLSLLSSPASAWASSKEETASPYRRESSLRGTLREETHFSDPLRNLASAAAYIPRKAADGLLYGTGHAAAKLSDKDFIRKVKDILYFYDEKLLWYPALEYTSGFRPAYGGGLYYKDGGWRAHAKALVHDAHYVSYRVKGSYQTQTALGRWKNSLGAVYETKDDRRFYGMGADPRNDHRNTFVGSDDYGIYTENRRKIQWETSLQIPESYLDFELLGYYQRRSYKDHGHGNKDVRDIFDHSRIPGFDAPTQQLYHELSTVYDSRSKKNMLSPGFRAEAYSGLSAGFGKYNANLFRSGFDVAAFLPVIQKNRLIVPRLAADLVKNMNDEIIPFSEYPRQHLFRGVSNRDIVRSEQLSLVPSLEYQWPLSHMLGGHVFLDTLFVGPRPSSIRWHEGLWAAGLGFDFHYFSKEFARLEMAWGSEGFQLTVSIGKPFKRNARKDW